MESNLDVKPRASHVRQICVAVLATTLCIASSAVAEEAKQLTKAEVESLVVGKKIQYLSASTGATIGWDSKSDGSVYFSTTQTRRNTQIRGTYTIEDDGSLCHKWGDDKYLHLQDGCVLFMSDEGKTHVVSKRSPDKVFGDVVQ